MANIVIVDDDKGMCYTLENIVKQAGHHAVSAYTLSDGLKTVYENEIGVVFLDVQMPDGNGLDFLPRIMNAPSQPEVIIITGKGNEDGAEIAINSGAWDYIEKPASMKVITLPLLRALQYREEKKKKKLSHVLNREGIIGSSAAIRTSLDLMAQAAQNDSNVLITGETGTGKELFAHAIHRNSVRSDENFVIVDCASLPTTLVESVLFGHQKGAYTGATETSEGLIKQADGGTLFLDEIGELPPSIQKTFLRVLQEHRFRPVGGNKEITSNFRLITATNRDINQMVQKGEFRQDLLFRVQTIVIDLPSLRKRKKDIREIAMHYMTNICDRYQIGTKGFSPDFLEMLTTYAWPGNIRELINAMESILNSAGDDPVLFAKHFPVNIRIKIARDGVGKKQQIKEKNSTASNEFQNLGSLKDYRNDAVSLAEKDYLNKLMAYTQWDIKASCRISGLSRTRLYDLLKKYHIQRS